MTPTTKNTFLNIFDIVVDTKSVVTRLDHRSSWLWPLISISAGIFLMGMANQAIVAGIVENNLPVGMPEDQIKQTTASFLKYQRAGLYLAPFGVALKWLCSTGLLFLSCVMLDINVSFKRLFALISQCGFITFFQDLTVFLIIRAKGDAVRTIRDLSPQLGLDLVFNNQSKPLMLTLNYFSIFNICYIVVLTITVATLGKCSRARAFLATIPNWILPLLFGLGMLFFNGDQIFQ